MAIRVVIVGGGFGGLETAFALKSLGKPRFDITLVDKSAYHAFIPSIHLIISGKVKNSDISIPLGPVLGTAGIRFIRDTAIGCEADKRELITAGGSLPYDYCVISTGATNNFFGLPGAEQFACRFRTPEDAEQIGTALLALLKGDRPCRMAIAGAGTEGVEVAGEMLDLVHAEGRGEDLKAGRISIELFEGKSALLPGLPVNAGAMAEDYLRQHGVTIVAGDRIAGVGKDSVLLEIGRRHDVSLLVWSGGIQPSRLVEALQFPKDPWGWLKVTEYLHVQGDERMYGIGDAVSIYSNDGPLALQRLAYHAKDQARVAALNIAAHASGRKPVRYEPKNKPQLISIGDGMGIFSSADRIASGPWVITLKKAIERKHLMTYLSKPLSSALWSRLPGANVLHRLRIRLPI
jgi:NADH dehydrogenase